MYESYNHILMRKPFDHIFGDLLCAGHRSSVSFAKSGATGVDG